METNKNSMYYYPDYDDENFVNDISNRLEFQINLPKKEKECSDTDFQLSSYQIFLKNFISEETPYKSLLIFHGTGTGKTCSAVSIAENYKDIYFNKNKRIIVLLSKNILDGWKNTIYNPGKGTNQCTDDTYVQLMENNNKFFNQKVNEIKDRNKLVKKFYDFYGYRKFANYVKEIMNKYSQYEKGDNVDKLRIKAIKETFSNRLLIIDEVHNIRSDDNSKAIMQYLNILVKYSDNLKLIMLSATPMYNKSTEIIWLLNLMLSNDNRARIYEKDIFDNEKLIDADGIDDADGTDSGPGGKEILEKNLRGYVSYIRGETPDKFPIRLYPSNNILKNFPKKDMFNKRISNKINILKDKLFDCQMIKDKTQQITYNIALDNILRNKTGQKTDKKLQLHEESQLMQISNIVYPSESDTIKNKYGEKGLNNIFSIRDNKYTYKNQDNPIFDIDRITDYSIKIKKLLEVIKQSQGIIFIYSQYIQSGVIPLMLALEQNGYQQYSNNTILDYQGKIEPISYQGESISECKSRGKEFKRAKFIVITGTTEISKNNTEEIRRINEDDNKNGEEIKIIIGSVVASEGLDLKRIREIHVLDPWHHLNRMEQIIGRGIRYCSHSDLEVVEHDEKKYSKENVLIYLYTGTLPDDDKDSIDISIYRRAEKKSVSIGEIELILKKNAIDCKLFGDINIIGKNDVKPINLIDSQGKLINDYEPYDRKYTKACSYRKECNYTCNYKKKTIKKEINTNTFNNQLGKNIYSIAYRYIKELFKIKSMYTINDIVEYMEQYINLDKQIIYLTLQNMIRYPDKSLYDINGQKGYLIYNNKYYIFQPDNISNKTIPYYDRLVLKDNVQEHINLEVDEDKNLDKIKTLKKSKTKPKDNKEGIYAKIEDNNIFKTLKGNESYNWITDDSDPAKKLRYEYNMERLDISEKEIILNDLIINNNKIKNVTLEETIRNYYKYNLINDKYELGYTDNPIGFNLFDLVKPRYFIKGKEVHSDVRDEMNKNIKNYIKTAEYKKRFPTKTPELWIYNYNNNGIKSRLIHKDTNKPTINRKKNSLKYGAQCENPTPYKLDKWYNYLFELIEILGEPDYTIELKQNPNKNVKTCILLEMICRRLSKETNDIYYYSYDSFFMRTNIINIISKYNGFNVIN